MQEPRRWGAALEALAATHEHPMVAWKVSETAHMVRHGLGASSGKLQAEQHGRL